MVDGDLNGKIGAKWVTKAICKGRLGEETSSKTQEEVGKITTNRKIMRLEREFGNEGGEEEEVEGIFNNRRRNGGGGAGRRLDGREGSIKRRRLKARPRRMRKGKNIRSRRRRIRKTTRKRGGKEKLKILKLSR